MSLCKLAHYALYADNCKILYTLGLQSDILCKTQGSVQGSVILTCISINEVEINKGIIQKMGGPIFTRHHIDFTEDPSAFSESLMAFNKLLFTNMYTLNSVANWVGTWPRTLSTWLPME